MAEECKDVFSKAFSYGSISFSLLLAKESGIFDTLLAATKPLTSGQVAQENSIKERYAREILGCLTSASITRATHNEDGGFVYHLEEDVKKFLSEGTSIPYMNFIKILMTRYEEVKDCLKLDRPGVVRYHPEYYDGVDEIRAKTTEGNINFFLHNVPQLKEKLEKGIDVIEFGCGRAYILSILAAKFPLSTFTASEVRDDLLDMIREQYSHLSNMRFEVMDLCALPASYQSKYDWALAVDVMHDLPYPKIAMAGIRRLVREDGVFTFADPTGSGSHLADAGDVGAASLYSLSTFLCIPESFQQEESEAHGACWGKETAQEFANSCGFNTSVISMDGKMCLFVAKPI